MSDKMPPTIDEQFASLPDGLKALLMHQVDVMKTIDGPDEASKASETFAVFARLPMFMEWPAVQELIKTTGTLLFIYSTLVERRLLPRWMQPPLQGDDPQP